MHFACEYRLVRPSVLVARLAGTLDAGSAVEFEDSLSRYLKSREVDRIILDAPDLTFISSSGLRIFMLAIKALAERNGRLGLAGAATQIARLLSMSGLDKWMDCRESLADFGVEGEGSA